MTDYFDYFDLPDSWAERPLLETRDNTVCMPIFVRISLKRAITMLINQTIQRAGIAGDTRTGDSLRMKALNLQKLRITISDIPRCSIDVVAEEDRI